MGYAYYVDINVLREVNGGSPSDISEINADGGAVATVFTGSYDGYNV